MTPVLNLESFFLLQNPVRFQFAVNSQAFRGTPPSTASRTIRDPAAGDNIYCSPRTVNSVVTSALDRLGQHLLLVSGRVPPRFH